MNRPRPELRVMVLAVAAAFAGAAAAQSQLPTGGTTVAGSATITTNAAGNAMTVQQTSQRAVLNWSTYNLTSDRSMTYNQPNASAIAVNRVSAAGGPSSLHRPLTAN